MGCSVDATGLGAAKSLAVNDNNGTQESDTVVSCSINATSSDVVESTNDVGCVGEDHIDMPPQNNALCMQAPEPFNFPRGVQDHGIW